MNYADLELRVLAARGVLEGIDLHRERAAEMFGVKPEEVTDEQRRVAKAENFRKIYGDVR